MPTSARLGVAGLIALALAGCNVEPLPPADLCRLTPPDERSLAGVFIGRPAAVPAFALLPLDGRAARKGGVERLDFEGLTFNARPDEASGGLRSRPGDTAVPLAPLTGKAEGVFALDVAYTRKDGAAWTGRVVTGAPLPDSLLATVGRSAFSGTVLLTVIDLAAGSANPVEAQGEARLEIGFGSRSAALSVRNLRATGGGSLPFEEIVWTDLSLCGARVGSTGAGGFELVTEAGVEANRAATEPAEGTASSVATPVADDAQADPLAAQELAIATPVEVAETAWGEGWGSAVFLGRFYGLTDGGQPKSASGGFLIEGDSGLVSGVFVLTPG